MRLRLPSIIVPRGDWIETYPTTNGKIVLGMRLAVAYIGFCMLLVIGLLLAAMRTAPQPVAVPEAAITIIEILGWFIGGIMGLAVGQFIGKRKTANPEIMKSSEETQSIAITATHEIAATAQTTPQAAAAQGDYSKVIAQELSAKAKRQAGTEFEGEAQ